MLNWSIIKSPINWFIVILMLVIAGFVIDIVAMPFVNSAPAKSNS